MIKYTPIISILWDYLPLSRARSPEHDVSLLGPRTILGSSVRMVDKVLDCIVLVREEFDSPLYKEVR